jgi:hypothetical protein
MILWSIRPEMSAGAAFGISQPTTRFRHARMPRWKVNPSRLEFGCLNVQARITIARVFASADHRA